MSFWLTAGDMDLLKRMWFGLMYLGKPPWDTGISPPELMQFIEAHAPGGALDLGCGTGTNAITLARSGWQVTGIDFAGKAIRNARKKARQAGLKIDFRRGDVSRLRGIAGPFELILDIGCFHSLEARSKERYAASLPQLLVPGGTYLVYAWMDEEGKIGTGLQTKDLELLSGTKRGARDLESKPRWEVGFRASTQPTKKSFTVLEAGMPEPGRRLHLVGRQDGTERGARPAAWLNFQCVTE